MSAPRNTRETRDGPDGGRDFWPAEVLVCVDSLSRESSLSVSSHGSVQVGTREEAKEVGERQRAVCGSGRLARAVRLRASIATVKD